MHRLFCGLGLSFVLPFHLAAADWSQFRGPNGDGHADSAKLPTEWDQTKNVTGRKELPGLGWSSPVVANGRIFLPPAVPGDAKGDYSLRAICLDVNTGDVIWNVEVFRQDSSAPPIQGK